jgi:hypothetical protein
VRETDRVPSAASASRKDGLAWLLLSLRAKGETLSKHRIGGADVLLIVAILPALTGHFYVLMSTLALYAVLYYRSTKSRQR